ncbi:2-oxo acid dehydrogenase subunit E2 [Arthrobacter sp. PAMC25564]|nr:2-oxo acid dehydrogenase subunit E2 [Arthrobacter sp. PAMC25564]
MPRLSDTMEEGVVSRWLMKVGDRVHKGDVLAEIDTDKTTMDLEAYEEGVLEQLLVPEGETVKIGLRIAVIGDGSGTAAPAAEPGTAPAAEPRPSPAEAPGSLAPPAPAGPPPVPGAGVPRSGPESEPPERVLRSPLARRIAREHHLDLAAIKGTGPGGRIVRADVEDAVHAAEGTEGHPAEQPPSGAPAAAAASAPAAVTAPATAPMPAGGTDVELPLNANQRITAERLSESAAVPTFCLTAVVDADRLLAFRAEINQRLAGAGVKLSVTDLLVRASAVALRLHPEVNSSWGGNKIIRRGGVHVGIAVALETGLIVPVIRDADRKSVGQIAAEAKELATRAREGKLAPAEFKGGTFTISNLGMFGIDNFTAIINPPEAAILAVGSAVQEAVVRDGQLGTRSAIKLTMTVDHRVLNGASGAAFLRDLTSILEEPLRIVV